MAHLSYPELREQLIQAAQQLFQAGVMSHSGHGNLGRPYKNGRIVR